MRYTINYNTGAGNETIETEDMISLKALADEGITYTQQVVTIDNENGTEVSRREWYSNLDGIEECDDPIQFGSFGYYSDWND